ncbi:hypothetical protein RB200_07900 [Streptomyces sp. PmtG]
MGREARPEGGAQTPTGRGGRGGRGGDGGVVRTRVPVRKSLLTRLLAVSALVSVLSIAATAWLAAQTTSGAIRQEQGQVLADDARIYDRLLGLAATTPNWRDADRTVRDLSVETGRRIALTTQDRKVIADSASRDPHHDGRLPARASAVVDPLAVDSTLATGRGDDTAEALGIGAGPDSGEGLGTGTGAVDRIDPRAVGPFRLPAGERRDLRAVTERSTSAACGASASRRRPWRARADARTSRCRTRASGSSRTTAAAATTSPRRRRPSARPSKRSTSSPRRACAARATTR